MASFRPTKKARRSTNSTRLETRRRLETLEKREMLAAEVYPSAIFAPGTPADIVFGGNQLGNPQGASSPLLSGTRWTQTATGIAGPNAGDRASVTWSIVRDGTPLINPNTGANEGTSNLIAFLDGIYGDGGGTTNLMLKPWFRFIAEGYNRWGDESGLDLVYEPNDDGAGHTAGTSVGVVGVRGDMRIAGRLIDGNSNVLAFNYFPNAGGRSGADGDMVIDTGDNFYVNASDGPNGANVALVNIIAHEAGHGIGLAHTEPVNGTKLMEPFINLGFIGPQEDDLYDVHELYGDRVEPNDTQAAAHDLSTLRNQTVNLRGLSVDNGNDVDVFRFDSPLPTVLTVQLDPTGTTYLRGPQGGTPSQVQRAREADLRFRVLDSTGAVIANVNQTGLGGSESAREIAIPAAGTYFVEVTATGDTQLYDLGLVVGRPFSFNNAEGRPRLLAVNPDADKIFELDRVNVLQTSPRELTFRFAADSDLDPTTLVGGIRVSQHLSHPILGNSIESVTHDLNGGLLESVFYDLSDVSSGIVRIRFANPLKDGQYRITVYGEDIANQNVTAVRNRDGETLVARTAGTVNEVIPFELELPARVLSVVPQPVVIGSSGISTVERSKIHVYFDDSDLFAGGGTSTLLNRAFYQLVSTKETLSPTDDRVYTPTAVTAVEIEQRQVPDPANPGSMITVNVRVNRVELDFGVDIATLPLGGEGTYRLQIGSSTPVPSATSLSTPTTVTPPGDVSGLFGTALTINPINQTVIVSQTLTDAGLPFDLPGNYDEVGHRDIPNEEHISGGASDTSPARRVISYNFALTRPYANRADGSPLYTSINEEQKNRFRETMELWGRYAGIEFVETVSSGLTLAVGELVAFASGPGGVLGEGGGSGVVMDAAENWNDGYGRDNSGRPSFFETALHEIGHAIGLGHSYDLAPSTTMGAEPVYGGDPEFVYPGNSDIIHATHLHRPDNRDVDYYSLTVPVGQSGNLRAETFSRRNLVTDTVNTHLSLFRREPSGVLTLLTANDDSFDDDAAIEMKLEAGTYVIGVTASGNQDYAASNNFTSGSGGNNEGSYQLRVRFDNERSNVILDAAGTPLDGDADGQAGGNFQFFFKANTESNTIYVDASAAVGGTGTRSAPFRHIDDALAAATPGRTVRIVGNRGANGDIGLANNDFLGTRDNVAYTIGRIASLNQDLNDGRNLVVPKDVNVVIDAGVVIKMLGSRILVGSEPGGVDASGGTLQILGTPDLPVFITSYNDLQFGLQSNPLGTPAAMGNWGGIDIRDSEDTAQGREKHDRQGLFLNTIFNSRLSYGGGTVSVNGQLTTIEPIRLDGSRPTLVGNTIVDSASAAISADPDSFRETSFNAPLYQRGGEFEPSYDRVGPEIYGNFLTDNSLNGLLVRIDTTPSNGKEQLLTSARFDDTDIVHILGDDLVIAGNAVGAASNEAPADPSLTTVQAVARATGETALAVGTYQYRISFVDIYGNETPASAPTVTATVAANQIISLGGLNAATGEFNSRRLYRSFNGGAFQLVADLDRATPSYRDDSVASTVVPVAAGGLRQRYDARLQVDPGIIVKSDGVRIELGFGADLIAEGLDGKPVVFTSRGDDRYGIGGSFDTSNDGTSQGAAADWAGIYARPNASVSLDHAVVAFGGGQSSVDGTTARFNALQILQADARVANSVFENNASGTGSSDNFRSSRGPNDASVIHVSGAQPVIVNNLFRDSAANTAAISINVNAMMSTAVRDLGRQSGAIDLYPSDISNSGPLVRGNRFDGTGVAGMRIRGEVLTHEVVFDDTDIVHIVASDITDTNLHTSGGLRLQSRVNESLVVKFANDVSLKADGRPLDIDDRVGGRLIVIGQPDHPVILTSLSDDTVGAGTDSQGRTVRDTMGDGPTTGTAGSWTGLIIDEFSHDRNVDVVVEREGVAATGADPNGLPTTAQSIGALAPDEKSGDDNLRLGFDISGMISSPGDIDTYRFEATAGTTVWFDIDRTDSRLNSVIELVDANGTVLARSVNSTSEVSFGSVNFAATGINANVLHQSSNALRNRINNTYRDSYTTNPLDAGMRVVLPGAAGATSEYFVRVTGGLINGSTVLHSSSGAYQLNLRLRETDEFAGSTVQYADIRFAETGIDVNGGVLHSPLTGEGAFVPGTTTNLGWITSSDRAGISVSGNLTGATDVNRYSFVVGRDAMQSGGAGTGASVTFDIDYADGLPRPDTSLLLYYTGPNGTDAPTLVMIGRDSNVGADRSQTELFGHDFTSLDRGSSGARDAYLGTVYLIAGHYQVAVIGDSRMPSQFTQFFQPAPGNPNLRLEPISSIIRIAQDTFDPAAARLATAAPPVQTVFAGNTNVVPFGFGNMEFIATGPSAGVAGAPANTDVHAVFNAQTGTTKGFLNTHGRPSATASVGPITTTTDGISYTVAVPDTALSTDANTQAVSRLIVGTNNFTAIGNTGIETFHGAVNAGNVVVEKPHTAGTNGSGHGMEFTALTTFVDSNNNRRLFGVASRGNGQTTYRSVTLNGDGTVAGFGPVLSTTNMLYELNPDTGAVIQAHGGAGRGGNARATGSGTDAVEFGKVNTTLVDDTVVAMTQSGNQLLAITQSGEVVRWNVPLTQNRSNNLAFVPLLGTPVAGVVIPFVASAATNGYQGQAANTPAAIRDLIFIADPLGAVHAFNSNFVPQNVFGGGTTSVNPTSLGALTSLALANLDANPWHVTNDRAGDAGHGTGSSLFDNRSVAGGGNSLRFGYENPGGISNPVARPANDSFGYRAGAYGSIEGNAFNLVGYAAADKPVLYFNYLLDNAAAAAGVNAGSQALDSLRVYVSSDDRPEWVLVSTNNEALLGHRADAASDTGYDESDIAHSRYSDLPLGGGERFVPSILADNALWRQARVSLSPWAGHENVRIRMDFNTAGEPEIGAAEIRSVSAARLVNATAAGRQFRLVSDSGTIAANFEFNFGLVLRAPSGSGITNGQTISITRGDNTVLPFVFVNNAGTLPGNQIAFLPSDSASVIATKIRTKLQATFGAANVTVDTANPERIAINDPTGPATLTTAGPLFLMATAQPTAGFVAIPALITDTAAQILTTMRTTVADTLDRLINPTAVVAGVLDPLVVATQNLRYPVTSTGLTIPGFAATAQGIMSVFQNNIGATASAINAPGSESGVYLRAAEQPTGIDAFTRLLTARGRTAENTGEGVFIDDIIIGFAERGETVINATPGVDLVANPNYELPIQDNGAVINVVDVGAYQMELRLSAQTTYADENESVVSIDTNVTLAEIVELNFAGVDPSILSDSTLTGGTPMFVALSDGEKHLNFEFENIDDGSGDGVVSGNIPVPFRSNMTAAQLATAFRTAVNTVAVSSGFGVTALSSDGRSNLDSSSTRVVLNGRVSANGRGGVVFANGFAGLTVTIGGQERILPVAPGAPFAIPYGIDTGDRNIERQQGQLLIRNNIISDSESIGISIDSGRRDRSDISAENAISLPRPGSARAFSTSSPGSPTTSAVLLNNLIIDNGLAGIQLSGDAAGTAPAPFARVINNTVFGSNTGILVNQGATPTLINNAIVGNNIGVSGDASTATMQLFANLFAGNTANTQGAGINTGGFAIFAANADAVFVDANGRNFYPAVGSRLIDNSLSAVEDRFALKTLRESLGIPGSSIVAPTFDLTGQTRADDPTVNNTSGTGSNVFIDVGALDRSDRVGPLASLIDPLDDDLLGIDIDGNRSFVQLTSGTYDRFVIQLTDINGTGVRDASVLAEAVTISQDGVILVKDVDYYFDYSDSNDTITLTPISGIWLPGSAYEITLNNRNRTVFRAQSGDNTFDGETLTIVDLDGNQRTFEYDSGNVIQVGQSTSLDVIGTAASFVDRSTFTLTSADGLTVVTFEIEKLGGVAPGNIPVVLTGLTTATQIRDALLGALTNAAVPASLGILPRAVGTNRVQLGGRGNIGIATLPTGLVQSGLIQGVIDGDLIRLTIDGTAYQFEFDDSGLPDPFAIPGNLDPATTDVIPIIGTETPEELADAIVTVMLAAGIDPQTTVAFENGIFRVGGTAADRLEIFSDGLSLLGRAGTTSRLSVTVDPTSTGTLINGSRVTITSDGVVRNFLLTTNSAVVTPDTIVLLNPTDDFNAIATALANSISVTLPGFAATNVNGVVILGEPTLRSDGTPITTTLTENSTLLSVQGVAGGAIAIPFDPTQTFSAEAMAGLVISAISRSGLNITPFTPGGGLVYLDNVASVVGPATATVGAIEDSAGNDLQSNRTNLETQFTILMPGVELDFGDATSPLYATLLTNNGPRHTINAGQTPRLGLFVDAERNGSSSDDAAQSLTLTPSANLTVAAVTGGQSVTVNATTVAGNNVRVTVGATVVGTFEFVLGGASPVIAGAIGVLIIPGEQTSITARRLATAIETALKATTLPASVRYTLDNSFLEVVSIDDEDGVGIGTGAFNGLFMDSTGTQVIGFLNPLAPNGSLMNVRATGSGLLDAWVDFNVDGDFDDLGEQILANQPVADGNNLIRVFAPSSAPNSMTQARFRISNTGNTTPNGIVLGGEVEDHRVVVQGIALPVAVDDVATINEDNNAVGNVSTNDNLAGATATTPLPFVKLRDPSNGTVAFNSATGAYTYTPNDDFYGSDFFVYHIVGSRTIAGNVFPVQSEPATVRITVQPVNDAPTAVEQNVAVIEPSNTTPNPSITVPASLLLTGAQPHADSPTLLPPWNELEQTLTVVQIAVIGSNGLSQNVVANSGNVTQPTNGIYTADAYVNGAGGLVFAGTVEVTVASGAVSQVVFTPSANYNELNPRLAGGAASRVEITYTVADDGRTTLPSGLPANPQPAPQTTTALLRVRVTPQNDLPIANNDRYDATTLTQPVEDTVGGFSILIADLLANDTNGEVDTTVGARVIIGSRDENAVANDLTLVTTNALGAPLYPMTTTMLGTVTLGTAGNLIYTPPVDYFGPDSFTYTVIDGGTDTSVTGVVTNHFKQSTATVNLYVAPQNDTPSVIDRAFTTNEDTTLTVTAQQLYLGTVGDALPEYLPAVNTNRQDEVNQVINVVALTSGATTINATTTNRLKTPRGTILANFDPVTRFLIDLAYTPDLDLNATDYPNVDGSPVLDQFTFTLADDGIHLDPADTDPTDGIDTLTTPVATVTGVARITVTSVNDIPDFTQPANLTLNEDAPRRTVTISGIVAGSTDPISGTVEPQPLAMTATSSNTSLIPSVVVNYTSPSGTATIDFQPLPDTYGTSTISITVQDGGLDRDLATTGDNLSVTKTFVVTVNPVNDRPSTTDKAFTTNEDTSLTITAAQLFAGSAGDATPMTTAPQDESNQRFQIISLVRGTTSINATTTNILKTARGTVVANFDTVTGFLIDLVYTPDLDLNATDYPNADGSPVLDQFTFVVADDGLHIDPAGGPDFVTPPEAVAGVARITVTSINDAPDFTQPVNLTLNEDAPLQTVTIAGIVAGSTDPVSGTVEPQPLAVTATTSNTSLIPSVVVNYSTPGGTATVDFQSLPDTYGTSTITVTVEDGGLDRNLATRSDNLSVTKSFVVTVNPVNDRPSTTDKAFTTNEDTSLTITAAELFAGSAGHANPSTTAPQDESNQTFRIVSLVRGTNSINATTTNTLKTARGTVVANFDPLTGFLVDLEYTPDLDLNATDYPNLDGSPVLDQFTFIVADDGLHINPTGGSDLVTPPQAVAGVARIFVNAVNDLPSFNQPSNLRISEDAIAQTVTITGINPGGNEPQTMSMRVTSSNTFLVLGATVIYDGTSNTGRLVFQPQPDRYGSTTLTVTLTDAGLDNDLSTTIDNLQVVRSFVVDVDPINDAPGAIDQSVVTVEDTPITITASQLLAGSSGDAVAQQPAPFDESAQTTRIRSLSTVGGTVDATSPVGRSFATTHGSIVARFDSSGFLIDVVYTPSQNFNSDNPQNGGLRTRDSFTFTVVDDGLTVMESGPNQNLPVQSSIATARILVTPRNDRPVANDDVVPAAEDTPLVIPLSLLLGNDTAGPLTASDENLGTNGNDGALVLVGDSFATTRGGTVTVQANGDLLYEPPLNVFGQDTFVYTVADIGENEDVDGTRNIVSLTDTAVVTINIAPVNDAPSFDVDTAITIQEDTTGTMFLTNISAGGGETQPLRFTALSENSTLLANPVATYSPSTRTASLALVPNANQFGVTRVIASVEDPGLDGDFATTADNLSFSRTFIVRINPVNDAPTLDVIANQSTSEDANATTINLTGISAGGGETQTIEVRATSSNPSITGTPVVDYTSPAGTGTLTITPVANAFGTATITVVVIDAGLDGNLATTADNGSLTRTFTYTVASVNDDPTINPVANQTVNEDAGQQQVPLSGISDGLLENGPVTLTVTSSNPSLIPNPTVSAISPAGTATLSYTPVANQSGVATITIRVSDSGNGGAPRTTVTTFNVVVNAVNDLPTIDAIPDQTMDEDSTRTVALTGLSAGGGETQSISVRAISSNETIVSNPTIGPIAANGTATLTLSSVNHRSGTATISVVIEDGGLDNNLSTAADNFSVTRTFSVNVLPVNDPPTITAISPISVNEDSGQASVPLSGISTGATEVGPVLVTAVSNNPSLLGSVSVAHDGTLPIGTLRFTPVADAFGTGTITVSVMDGGGDNNLTTTADNLTTSTTLTVTVLNVNDPPVMGAVLPDPVEIAEDSAPVNVTISGVSGGPGETSRLQVRTSSSDPARLPNPGAVYDEATGTIVLSLAPVLNAFGTIPVTVTVIDPGQDGNFTTVADNLTFDRTINVTIIGSNDAPVAVDDELASDEDTIVSISEVSLLQNDTDPDLGFGSSEQLSISLPILTTTLGVPLTFNPTTRVITYDPTNVDAIQSLQVGDRPVVDTFVYELSDVVGATPRPRATVTITLAGLNDAPRVADDLGPFETGNGFIVIRPLRNDTDIDGTINLDSLIITADPQFGSVDSQVVNGEVVLTYSPNSDFEGTDSFRYTVEDNSGRVSDQATIVIRPTSGPTIGADMIPARVGGSVTIDVLANDVPISGTLDRSSARIDTPPRNGTASFDASGNLVYTPNSGFVGTDSFTYSVEDSEGNLSISPAVEVRVVQSGLTNARNFHDVNANGEVTPLDSLLVTNFLRRRGLSDVPVGDDVGPNFVDTDDSMNVTPLDALLVINFLRRQGSNRSGESIQVSANAVDTNRVTIASLQQSIFVDTITSVTPQVVIPNSVDSDELTHSANSVIVNQSAADQAVAEMDFELPTSPVEIAKPVGSNDRSLGRLSDEVFSESNLDDWKF